MKWFHNLSIKTKVLLPISFLALLMVGQLTFTMVFLTNLGNNNALLEEQVNPAIHSLLKADTDLHQMRIAETAALKARQNSQSVTDYQQEFSKNYGQIQERLLEMVTVLEEEMPKLKVQTQSFIRAVGQWEASQGSWGGDFSSLSEDQFEQYTDQLDALITQVGEYGKTISDQTVAMIDSDRSIVLTVALTALAVCLLIVLAVPFVVIRPITQLNQRLIDISSGGGDLTQRITVQAQDELGELSVHLNEFLDLLHGIVKSSVELGDQLSDQSTEVHRHSKVTLGAVEEQNQAILSITDVIGQLSASIEQELVEIRHSSQAMDESKQHAEEGRQVIISTVSRINQLNEQITSALTVIEELVNESNNIGGVLDVIRGIAEQTNLLALNAAIEAARAGEQGRGFAVVADEVRSLASKTQSSTTEIQSMIEALQQKANATASAIEQGSVQSLKVKEAGEQAGESLKGIVTKVQNSYGLNQRIASEADNQEQTVSVINNTLQSILASIAQTKEGANINYSASDGMMRQGQELKTVLSRFKV